MSFYIIGVATIVALYFYNHFNIDPKWLVYALTLAIALAFAFLLNSFGKSRDEED
jgi:hypothetical protein